jgi:hypothetical protein
MLLAFTLLQGLAWPVRLRQGWQPEWWQSHIWANVGHLLSLPALIPALILENLGIFNHGIELVLTVVGLLAEMAIFSVVVYVIVRRLFECYTDG